jgi:tRNA G10  N-methylase Trm11
MASRSVSHNWTLLLKLRGNIELEGDLQLAEMEIAQLLGCRPEPFHQSIFDAFVTEGTLRPADARYCRADGVVGYRVQVEELDLAKLFQRLSFVELVAGETLLPREYWGRIEQGFESVPAAFIRIESRESRTCFRLVPFNAVAEWSDILAKRASSPDEAVKALERTVALAVAGEMPDRRDLLPERARSARLTTGHLFHGLHVYKAKFFPRMVRSLLNICSPCAEAFTLDPYVGSGTALTEASLLGMASAGQDIDPLSVLIVNAKVSLLHAAGKETIENALDVKARLDTSRPGQLSLFQLREKQVAYAVIPSFLARRIPAETQEEVAKDIALSLSAMDCIDDQVGLPLRVALSDAISRKFKFRFLGLGYGRFSLKIMPGRIVEMFRSNLDYLAKSLAVWCWLRDVAKLTPAPSEVCLGDARALPFEDGTFDLIVTSPPYMPASSGRENYLQSKAVAMTALGLIGADEVDSYERTQVGSVHRSESLDGLPPKAREVVEWMASDEVRQVKAAATASYFVDLAQSLGEIRRVLRKGGRCAMVIARQHTFYRYQSRAVVRTIDNVEVVSELAKENGLEVEEVLHVELHKQNTVARPRSLDPYYETVLVLGKF